jgi:hypothetical protein
MKKFPPVFDKTEGAILNTLYEAPNDAHTSYTLARTLYPNVTVSTQEALDAFTETRAGTERLIVRGLVRAGERNTGADGVYFEKLRLTPKGEREAIRHRDTVDRTNKALAEAVKASEAVIEEMKKKD